MNAARASGTEDLRWRGLLRFGGAAALVIGVLLLGEIAVYASVPRAETAVEHFALFRGRWLAGLLSLDLLGMICYLLFVPTILSLYLTLRRSAEGTMLVAAVLFFVGIADFFATNTAFPLLSLADQYAAASTDAQRAMFLAAGQGMFSQFNENAFLVSYVIVSASWAMIAGVMLKSGAFGRLTAWWGILAGSTGILAVVLEHALPAGVLLISIALYFAAIVFLFLWVVMAGRRLWRLGNQGRPGAAG